MSEIQQKLELIRLQFDNLEMMLNSSASQPSEHSPMVLKFSNGVQLGIDSRGRFHLLLALSKSEEKIRSKLTAGIVIRTQTYAIGGLTLHGLISSLKSDGDGRWNHLPQKSFPKW